MTIWGSKAKETTSAEGTFFCPGCLADTRYVTVRLPRYFTLCFIPLFSTSTLAEHVHCLLCSGDFRMNVLTTSRDRIMAAVIPWNCVDCNHLNPASRGVCVACGALRTARGSVNVAMPAQTR